MTEFIVNMENRPGRLATIAEQLAALNVNIEALTAYGHNGEGTVRLITSDSTTTRRILHEADLGFEEHTVLAVRLPHRPGELARLTRMLANAGVNIDALYILRSNSDGIDLAISVDQPETALPHLDVVGGVLAD